MSERRIAYLGSSTALDGGSELCLLRMVRHFHPIHRITLFLPDDGPLFQKAREEGIDCVNLNFLRLRKHRGWNWARWWSSMRKARKRLEAECRQRGVELLHFNDFIDLPYYSVAKRLRIPSVTHLRLIISNPSARTLYRSAIHNAGCTVLPVSQAVLKNMIEGDMTIPTKVLYDPAPDSSHFHPKSQPRDPGPFRLTMVSKLLENKGHLNFLEVAHALEKRSPDRYSYTLVAPPSPGRENYEQRVRQSFARLPLDRSRWIGGAGHEALGQILRESDLLIHLPDTEDSFPGVVLESMACGTPVLAYRCGGIPEQLEQGAAGILVEPRNLNGVVEEVERLSSNEDLQQDIASQGLKRIQTEFSAERHFTELTAIYEGLLGE
ncbi:MAG: glycosyltransferase family 4 protein [Candidatus Omnitrophica bacterium]|nr:glycosyltransferase family 4 protein [Candidatus Omnitrophota bacterium]